ncbi:Flagellar biosynthesis protein FlhF [Zhongshania aliphaticivorans]|uniref:Flagellar biosynthesis protein FlhF n=1 Tax=Zhongshania aliphaticivorans TaxID=1470434 RepID=A0A5S9NJ93_9GAMM|nr:flagellar biosynthesis protein FlhF [Zhongshania aliphaticivorans]CAA0090655.1 Flagellar biosynthesis protein FlhF [Zhongshania aliphaticivorans]CAA0098150.1 Flagellar biosynthesis protein FlhF [Zhongshania aliphaticivorans]
MQVKKYQAADTQQAMRLVRAAHGPDAVILDCRSIAGGVEVVVSLESMPESSFASLQHNRAASDGAEREPTALDALLKRGKTDEDERYQQERKSTAPAQASEPAPQMVWSQNEELLTMKQEMASMKSMLMEQLKGHNWQEANQQAPEQQELNAYLSAMDIDPALGKRLCAEIPADESDTVQREMLKMLLVKKLAVQSPPSSGAICLVGPQGAGKTTTIAKIAAQYVLTHGRSGIAILTTDTARVGAQEQLRAYGRILQVPVHVAGSEEEAVKTYRLLRKKNLVLIDTAGISFRDKQGINELYKLVSAMQDVPVYLTLPADVETYVQSEIIDAYSSLNAQGAVLTRIDEAMRLGGSLSNLIQHRLPLVWCANGPRVPQNLSAADAGKLVNMAVRMTKAFEIRRQGPQTTAIETKLETPAVADTPAVPMRAHRGSSLNVRV